MRKVFHTSLHGHFVIPINDIKYVDTDMSENKVVVFFNNDSPSRYLHFIYPNKDELRGDVKALGVAIEKFHKGEMDREIPKEVVRTEQPQTPPSDPIDTLEVQ